jgi:glycosyltransferase involved in cell wall biosynthesis
MADALARLVASGDLRVRMGREGRAIVEQQFEVTACAERVADRFALVGTP